MLVLGCVCVRVFARVEVGSGGPALSASAGETQFAFYFCINSLSVSGSHFCPLAE